VKFDGWRVQLHKALAGATLYSRNGHDIGTRFRALLPAIAAQPVGSIVNNGGEVSGKMWRTTRGTAAILTRRT